MKWQGSYPALITPFRGGALDEAALRGLVRFQTRGGSSGLVACGSTGEGATLRPEEYGRIIQVVVDEARGKIPVIAGVSSSATWKAVEMAQEARGLGADALLVTSPSYNKPTQEGLFRHYQAVARAVPLPIMIYNIPGRTAVNVLPPTIVRITAACRNVTAVKEASGSLDQASQIIQAVGSRAAVLSGDDSLTLPMMAIGARGIVSVAANILPKDMARLCEYSLKGKTESARKLHLKLLLVLKALFIETNPIPLKAAAAMMGLCSDEMRLPLTPLTAASRKALRAALKRHGCLK